MFKNYEDELKNDLRRLRVYGNQLTISTDIDEKFNWLLNFDPGFRPNIDETTPKYEAEIKKIRDRQKKGLMAGSRFQNLPENILKNRLKADAIKGWLMRRI